jgi:DNA-binding beta-propeller fold protein YncE
VLCLWVLLAGVAHAQSPLTPVAAIELPGVEGRIDHLAYDPDSQRLFVAALGNDTVEIVDLRTNTRVRGVAGFHEPQGIAFVPTLKVAAVANGQGEGVTLLSLDGQVGKTIRLGNDADNVRWDARAERLFVGYGSGALAAVDPTTATVVGTVSLPGHPESFQLEGNGSRIFVNVPSAGQLALVDRTTMKVVASWPVTAARANYPLALDEAGHRLFVGCRQPARVLVYDSVTGREQGSFDIVGDTDDVFFDAEHQRLYVSGGEGLVDVFDARAGGAYPRLARVPTASGARTSLFVPALNRLVVAVPKRDGHGAQLRVFAAQ